MLALWFGHASSLRPGPVRLGGFLAGPVLVVGVLSHVQLPQPLRLIDEGLALLVVERLPHAAEVLGYFRVVHVWCLLAYFPALYLRPDHERVHRPLYVVWVVLLCL